MVPVLQQTEERSGAALEPVVPVELEGDALDRRVEFVHRALGRGGGEMSVESRRVLDSPRERANGMVERKTDVVRLGVRSRTDGLGTGVLENLLKNCGEKL